MTSQKQKLTETQELQKIIVDSITDLWNQGINPCTLRDSIGQPLDEVDPHDQKYKTLWQLWSSLDSACLKKAHILSKTIRLSTKP